MNRSWTAILAMLLFIPGCKSKDTSAVAASVQSAATSATPAATNAPAADVDAPCAEFAKAKCDRMDRLVPQDLMNRYGELAHCEERIKLLCRADASLPGMKLDASALRACMTAQNDKNDWRFDPDYPLGCHGLVGTARSNQPCIYDAQCASEVCLKARGALRGFCAEKVPTNVGDKCVVDRCGRGLTCVEGTCAERSESVMSRCDDEPCYGTKKLGARCDPKPAHGRLKGPDHCLPSLRCSEETRQCVKREYAIIGEPCGADGCRAGRCTDGICRAYRREEDACEYLYSSECKPPAQCFDSVCAIDPAPKREL